ncbi:MAG: OmpA family protein [Bacteroidetes bacterium]|nr:OmpA family protein [Bacteroidota bacterium]
MKLTTSLLLVMFLGILPFLARTQNTDSIQKPIFQPQWNLQVNGGITQYYGDLNRDNLFNRKIRGAFSGALGYQFSPVFGLRGQLMKGDLYSIREEKHLELNSYLWDASIQATASINDIFTNYNPERKVNFYLLAGGGITSFSSSLTNSDNGTHIDSSGSRQFEFFLPVGLGVAFRLAKNINLNLEYTDHITFNDNTLDLFPAKRARDQYSYTSVGLSASFGGPRDMDKDGIKDKKDRCPYNAGKAELGGCPDKDNDGITDKLDACPDVAGKGEFKGCPDTDNDGIPDKDDKCPAVAGTKAFLGCPDTDKDGVTDSEDKCPNVAGKKELAGCPDKDGDGIADNDDACPDQSGLAKFSGCPDRDNDGVPDNKDNCPDVAGALDNSGCPVQSGLLVNETVYFNTDEYFVIGTYNQLLNKIAETMRDNPGIKIDVDGHTDARESVEYNLQLSEKRADYVIKFFKDRGIEPSRLIKHFYGKSRPVADNSTEEGMRLNRRVEIKSVK